MTKLLLSELHQISASQDDRIIRGTLTVHFINLCQCTTM